MRQLILPFTETPHYAAADFVWSETNAGLRALLGRPGVWSNGRLAIWGEAGVGKTHLAHLWAAQSGAALIAGPGLRTLPQAAGVRPLAIDDADAAADEVVLFHTLNVAREASQPVLLTARLPPARAAIGLADLASRLRGSSVAALAGPDEEQLALLFTRLAAERQLAVPEAVRRYLLARLPREAGAIRTAVAQLDTGSLEAGRAVSLRIAATVAAGFDPRPAEEALSSCNSPDGPGFL